MQGLILCAGQGQRLKPLTDIIAKPALLVMNKPMIWHICISLLHLGVKSIYITLYHKAESIFEIGLDTHLEIPVNFLKEPILLNTGGGIRNAAQFIRDDLLLICSGDTLWDFDLEQVITEHMKNRRDLTLVLTATNDWQDYSAIRVNEQGRIVRIGPDIKITEPGSYLSPPYTFTGIYLLNTSLLNLLPNIQSFDFIKDFIAPLMMKGFYIHSSIVTGFWADLGTFQRYIDGCLRFAAWKEGQAFTFIAGSHCHLSKGAKVINSLLWDHVTVASNVSLKNCIAVSNVNLDVPIHLENVVLFPDTSKYSELAKYNFSCVSKTLVAPIGLADLR